MIVIVALWKYPIAVKCCKVIHVPLYITLEGKVCQGDCIDISATLESCRTDGLQHVHSWLLLFMALSEPEIIKVKKMIKIEIIKFNQWCLN